MRLHPWQAEAIREVRDAYPAVLAIGARVRDYCRYE